MRRCGGSACGTRRRRRPSRGQTSAGCVAAPSRRALSVNKYFYTDQQAFLLAWLHLPQGLHSLSLSPLKPGPSARGCALSPSLTIHLSLQFPFLPLDKLLHVCITSRSFPSRGPPHLPYTAVCAMLRAHSATGSPSTQTCHRVSSALEYCVTFPMTLYRRCQKGVTTNLYGGRQYGARLGRPVYLTITVFWCSYLLLPWRWPYVIESKAPPP